MDEEEDIGDSQPGQCRPTTVGGHGERRWKRVGTTSSHGLTYAFIDNMVSSCRRKRISRVAQDLNVVFWTDAFAWELNVACDLYGPDVLYFTHWGQFPMRKGRQIHYYQEESAHYIAAADTCSVYCVRWHTLNRGDEAGGVSFMVRLAIN